ncbi:MAG: hypothetical protein Q8R96_09825 [Bacteroidota bacterium]|nr:hypothetical protein [Bacteroidota bacterium]
MLYENETTLSKRITISAWLHFGENGELTNFISDDRYAFKGKNRMEQFRWQTPLRNYREINNRMISKEADLIYEYPEGDFCYGKFEMTQLQYNLK